ncbi:MAG: potassium-transporting ATPase subunit KdpA [Alphaproteobacteria bacterium]|uniref:Potassium-transporting ATPase potassium-binding subunit n=1 Tax=Candidatus Nitrobium versatile TaxID=2884831 RepID=A0A953SF11_9BACT|nr:potassium-transporting ATPase subunit KdpA [Candidatus Nitrobium versatile]
MTGNGIVQIVLYLGVLLLLTKPLGVYMARVYEGEPFGLGRLLGPVELLFYKLCGIRPDEEMDWKQYTMSVLFFSAAGLLVLYLLQRLQGILPLNPQKFSGVSSDSSFNTAVSFVTNTNWQGYGGELTMSYLTQMAGLAVQNFVSAATGMAVLVALIRGFKRQSAQTIGNFWIDLTRSTLYILLPLSLIWSLLLVSQGVVQTFSEYKNATLTQAITFDKPKLDEKGSPIKDASGNPVTEKTEIKEQVIPLGPAASQIAIKQLGTNGGGFFNVNSAHPLENPTPLANFLEVLAILLIPAALCITFGRMVGDKRQGWALLAAMFVVFVTLTLLCVWSEQQGNPRFAAMGIDQTASGSQPGGNMEGKEVRFGVVNSALWAVATTSASNGSVNSMHDSYTPLGGLYPMFLMQMGEVIFGGVGSGLYGLLVFAIITVFVAGLMVGRTPEYLGKKIEIFEMKMAALVILIPPSVVKIGTAIAVLTSAGVAGIANPGPHGFSEILYAFSSAGNNNGSAFAGLSANTPFYNTMLGLVMFFARFWTIIPVLAIAGSLAAKKKVPAGLGTLPTHTPLFVTFLIGVVVIVGALAFMPSLALGPVAEHLMSGK